MGKILLVLENSVREVNSLLAFHNVHPQVRSDAQRRLQHLIHRMYDHVGTLEPGYGEPPQAICSVIVNEVVNNTIKNVIPLAELAAQEKHGAALEQRIKDLEAELRVSEQERMDMEKYIGRFRKAHEFMLHSYFREVLILRYQLRDAVFKQRLGKANLYSPMQQSRQNRQQKPFIPGQPKASLPGERRITVPEEVPVANLHAIEPLSDVAVGSTSDSSSLSATAPGGKKLSGTLAMEITKTAWSPRITAMPKTAMEGGEVHRQTKSVETQTVSSRTDSVDAIFDYEEYIAQLKIFRGRYNNRNGKNSYAGRSEMTSEMEERERLKALGRMCLGAWDAERDGSMLKGSEEDGTLSGALSWRTTRAVRAIRKSLLDELNDIRCALERMQSHYIDDVLVLQDALKTVQARADSLLAFLATYAEEVSRISALIEMEVDTTGTSHVLSVSDAEWDPCQRRTVSEYFTSVSSLEVSMSSVWKDDTVNTSANFSKDERCFWAQSPETLEARRAFSALQDAVSRMRNRGDRGRRQGSLMGKKHHEDDSFGLFTSSRKKGIDAELDEDDIDLFSSLSRDQLLKLLVRLRMKRIAYGARYRNRLRQLADGARNGNRTADLQQALYEAWLCEQRVAKITRAIDWILGYLGDSENSGDRECASFTKNLALSPYLCDPMRMHEGEENVVYVPIPVDADRAPNLYATLVSNQPGYVVFNEDIIPISMASYNGSGNAPLPRGSASRGAWKQGAQGRMISCHGTVFDYCPGVQMGAPLGDTHNPFQVVWDPEERDFIFLEGERSYSASTPKKQQPPHVQQTRQKQPRQGMNLATILISPPLHKAEETAKPSQDLPSTVSEARRIAPEMKPISQSAYAPLETTPAVVYHVQSEPQGLAARSPSVLTPRCPGYLRLAQPRKEDRDLMRIESLSARQNAGECGGSHALPPLGRGTIALARLKGVQRKKKEEAVATARAEREHRMGEWKLHGALEAPMGGRRFLRMGFPCIPASSSSQKE